MGTEVRAGDPAKGELRPLSEVGLDDETVWGLVDAAPDAMVMVDQRGHMLLVNRQTERMFGYDRGELLGQPIELLLPERFRGAHTAHRTRYRVEPHARPMGAGLELFGRRTDGTEFPVEISLSPLQRAEGLVVIAAVRDITERVTAEARAREIRQALDATHEAVFMFDRDSLRYMYVNQGAVQQLGYTVDELLTMTPLHVKPDLDEAQLRALIASLDESDGRSLTYTTTHRRKDGTDLPVEVALQALSAGNAWLVSMARDISERIEAQERLREAEHELGLLEDRERIARDLHDRVIQRLFAAGMSLQATTSRIQQPEMAEKLGRVVDDLDETIREIRHAIFNLQAPAQHRGLRAEILDVVAEQTPALGFEPHVDFSGPVDATPDDVAADLLAVLREALSNAARHSRATAVEVSVIGGVDVALRVVDNGVGLPPGAGASGGNGLVNMRARASARGGSVELTPHPDGGTIVEWRTPVPLS